MERADYERIVEELRRENAALREENQRLRKDLEEWKRGHRERSKRRTSGVEGVRRGNGGRPGRKPGHAPASRPIPPAVDREVVHPMPDQCGCGGDVEETNEEDSTIVEDIPPVQVVRTRHVTKVGCCKQCKRRVATKLPGAAPHGGRVAAVVTGPNAQALIVSLRFDGRMSMPSICSILRTWFGFSITRGGVAQMLARAARWAAPSYSEIETHVRAAPVIGLDETGMRQDGVMGWAWLARTERASLFRIELSRGSWVAEKMLGVNFQGVVCSDFYGVYTRRDDWQHGYCGAHVIREVKKIAEVSPCERTIALRDRVREFYALGKKAQRTGDASQRHGMRVRLGQLIANRDLRLHIEVDRILGRLHEHFHGVTMFLDRSDVPADNNATERDLRPLAVLRKVTGGTRSPTGSETTAVWMSITQTLRKNQLTLRDYVIGLNHSRLAGVGPPSVFAPN